MAASVSTVQTARPPGAERRTVTSVTLDNSYLEGGEVVTAAQLGMKEVKFANCAITNGSESEEWVGGAWYTPATSKIHLLSVKTGKEVAKEKDMSKVVVQVTAFGF